MSDDPVRARCLRRGGAHHIACAASTRSEIVLPVWNGAGALLGVLDIDSDQPAAFTEEDAERLAAILAQVFGRL